MRFTALAVLILSATAAFASEPGQPLDCSDWVFLEPGLSCRVVVDACGASFPTEGCMNWNGRPADNAGGVLMVRQDGVNLPDCPSGIRPSSRIQVVRLRDGVASVLAYLLDRCGAAGTLDRARLHYSTDGHAGFEPNSGRLLLAIEPVCDYNSPGVCPYPNGPLKLIAIEGFTTTFEVLQTFTPTASAVGFRVPYMPEGLAAADHFDTYYGPLTHPINFASAQSLACDYPAAAPSIGDYLEVPAAVPDPPAGQGYWCLTSVTYQGETRYGRKASGGRLSGRDPGVFPACVAR